MRRLVPGRRDYDGGIAIPLGCSGSCNQGDMPCDCELSCAIPPDADRVIAAPKRTPEDLAALARIRRNTCALVAVCLAVLAALLECFGAQPFDRLNP